MAWNLNALKRQRKKLIGLLAVTLVAGGSWYWQSNASQPPRDPRPPVIVSRANIEEVVTAQGQLEPKQYVDVGTQVSGQLKAIYVDIGDAVKQGQLLAEIDPRVFQAQVRAGEARLNSLKAQLNQQKAELTLAEQNLQRNQNLIAANAVSRQVLQESESQALVAKAQVESVLAQIQETESNVEASRTNLGFTKIYAPISGTVTTLPTRVGQTLNANQTAPTIIPIRIAPAMTIRRTGGEVQTLRAAGSAMPMPAASPESCGVVSPDD